MNYEVPMAIYIVGACHLFGTGNYVGGAVCTLLIVMGLISFVDP